MEIREITNKEIWENFLAECEEKTFLSSWNWGEFQKIMGNKIWRLGVYDNEQLISMALVIKVKARRGTFLFVPHGPNIKSKIKNQKSKILEILLEKLKEITKEEKVSFIRIAPILEKNEENIKIFKKLSFRNAPIHMHPELTWELNINKSEEELLREMRKTTRYLIKQGLKNPELKIEKSEDLKDVEIFNDLYQKTVNRHHFVPFSLNYLKNEFSAFSSEFRAKRGIKVPTSEARSGSYNQILIFLARYKGEYLASAMIIFWQNIAFYHQGASLSSKIPASYLLQWETIKEAKRRGCHTYNFWGIAPIIENLKTHPWAGLTLFKMGFGGYKKEYVKTQDLPLSFKYWFNYLVEKFRKTKRGL